MEFDAFTGGVAPGGLRSKSDIRILICYILKSVGAPLSGEDIIRILQEKSLANYFEGERRALRPHRARQHQPGRKRELQARAAGAAASRRTSTFFSPLSVRDKAIAAAMAMLASAKVERENTVTTARTENGYNVTCHISGGDMELMNLTVYVPDLYQARVVKRIFTGIRCASATFCSRR